MSPDSSAPPSPHEPDDPSIDPGGSSEDAAPDPDRTVQLPSADEQTGDERTIDLGTRKPGGDAPVSDYEQTLSEGAGGSPFKGEQLPDAATLEGKQIGDYKVLSKLGEGGMGYVLKAHDRSLNRFVALKLLHPQMARKEAFVQQFRIEAEALAKLNHPNVVNVFNFGSTGGTIYFAMQFVRGQELSQLLKDQGQMAARAMVELMIPVVEGLAYTHGYGIMHRDLKPSNIMIDEASGRPIVTDFGLAKIDVDLVKRRMDPDGSMHFDIPLAEQGSLLGTPSYMAPETVAPDLYEGQDAQADVYAIGIIMYQLLTGVVPFRGESVSDVFAAKLSREPAPVTSLATMPPPPALVRCIGKAMARDPGDRYASMERLLHDLREVHRHWEHATEIEEKAQISREMALAMTHGGVTRHGSSPGMKRVLTLVILVVAGLALTVIIMKSRSGEGDPGGSDAGSVRGEDPNDNRGTDLVWEAGRRTRVYGVIDEISEIDDEIVVVLDDLRSETPRTAIFNVPRRIWDARNAASHLEAGGRGLLWGKVATTGDRGGIYEFTIDREIAWLVQLEKPTLQVKADGKSRSVSSISEDLIDKNMTVTGTIIGITTWDSEDGKHFSDLELYSTPLEEGEDPPVIAVSIQGRMPLASGESRPRLGDSLLAYGYVIEEGWVLVSEPEDLARSRINAAVSKP